MHFDCLYRSADNGCHGNSPDDDIERQFIEESMTLFELQERDITAFPALPVSNTSPPISCQQLSQAQGQGRTLVTCVCLNRNR